MPGLFVSNSALSPTGSGGTRRLLRAATLAALCGSLLFGTPALAQTEEPAADVPAVIEVTDPPAPEPTEPPAPEPTEAPPVVTEEPTDSVTEAPVEVTEEPTDPPTAVPTDQPSAIPTDQPTTIPSETPTPSPTGTPTATPSPTPAPELTYSLSTDPDCQVVPGQEAAIASNGPLDYTCSSTLTFHGTGIVPANITANWSVQAAVEGGWSVQLLPPVNNPADVVEWTPEGTSEAQFTFSQLHPAGTGTDVTDLDTFTQVTFGLRVHRAACALDPQTILLQHDVAIQTPETVSHADPEPSQPREPLRLTPDLLAVPEPAIAFSGALDFGEIDLTADGLAESTSTGTLTATVTNLDATCGDWIAQLSTTPMTDGNGLLLEGSQLVVVTINDQPVPDGGCNLVEGCDLATFTGDPSVVDAQSLVLGIELRMPGQAVTGAFQTSINAVLRPAGATTERHFQQVHLESQHGIR